jgi:ribosomal protein S18 acetylase RimI-like enzyme
VIDPLRIELLADAAWPAAQRIALGPWWLRTSEGVTRRANSVLTADAADLSGEELVRLVDRAERLYAERGLPAIFQISRATGARGLDALLERRGYAISGASEVWTAECRKSPATDRDGVEIAWAADPGQEWFDLAFDEPAERRAVHEQIVRRSPSPRGFALAKVDGQCAGCVMAVSAAGHTGMFCMATATRYRRRGIGLALVRALCAWAVERGDRHTYLQVMRENQAAKGLYRKAGFAPAYEYHYRMK